MIRVIAIDGVAGSGKSTLAKSLAKSLGWAYFDTGAMYRAVAVACLHSDVDPTNEDLVVSLARDSDIKISPNPDGINGLTQVTLNSSDISKHVRTAEVGQSVALVAVHKELRKHLVALQQQWIEENGDCVVEGRDIAAVVWPSAIIKIYLTADIDERAKRRTNELTEFGNQPASTSEVGIQLADRDTSDSTKGGLARVGDAIEIDTTDKDADQTLREVLNLVEPLI